MSMCICDSCDAFIDSDEDPDCCLGAEHHYLVMCARCREWGDDDEAEKKETTVSDNPAIKWLNSALDAAERSARYVRRHNVSDCAYCANERAKNNTFHPPHDASDRCESGKHNHCSCDTCF